MTETKTTLELSSELHITPRQLDHWCRRGLVPGQEVNPGSGRHREFTTEQTEHVRQMSVLVKNGFVPAKASEAIKQGRAGSILEALEAAQ